MRPTAAPSTKLSTFARVTTSPASMLRLRLGAPAGSVKTKVDFGTRAIKITGDAGGKSAATDRQDQHVRHPALGQLLHDLRGDCCLSFDDVLVVERRHHDASGSLRVLTRSPVALVEEIAVELDGDELRPEHAGLVDLLLRRGHRHEDNTLHPEVTADIGKALRMIARRSADEEALAATVCNRFAKEVEGAANLVGTNGRQIFPLQPDFSTIAGRKMVVELQRRWGKEASQRFFSAVHVLSCNGHRSIPVSGHRYGIGRPAKEAG